MTDKAKVFEVVARSCQGAKWSTIAEITKEVCYFLDDAIDEDALEENIARIVKRA